MMKMQTGRVCVQELYFLIKNVATVKALLKQVTELKKLGNLNDKQSALVDQIEDSASNLSDE